MSVGRVQWGSHVQMQFLHAGTNGRCMSSCRALRSLGSCVLGLQCTHYQHSPVQIDMFAFKEDVFCSNPARVKREESTKSCQHLYPRPVSITGMRLNVAPTNGSQRACTCVIRHSGSTLVPGHGNPGEKPLGKLCS